MKKYRRYKRLLLKKPVKTRVFLKRRTRAANKSLAFGFIFFAAVIAIVFVIKSSIPHFMYRVSVNNVQAFNIPPQEITYIYEICEEQNKDTIHALTAYCIYNRFFPEKRVAKTKEQIHVELAKSDKVRKSMSERRYMSYYNIVNSIMTEAVVFPVNTTESYMFGDTWNSKTCGVKHHKGADIYDRENVPGSVAVISMTNGIIEDKGKAGGAYYINVKTGTGAYFLYGNLAQTGSLEPGTPISAGGIIGYMSGGKNGPAKVHIGIKPGGEYKNGNIWINPYPFLRFLESAATHK